MTWNTDRSCNRPHTHKIAMTWLYNRNQSDFKTAQPCDILSLFLHGNLPLATRTSRRKLRYVLNLELRQCLKDVSVHFCMPHLPNDDCALLQKFNLRCLLVCIVFSWSVNFHDFHASDMSSPFQAAFFRSADVLVGAVGAALGWPLGKRPQFTDSSWTLNIGHSYYLFARRSAAPCCGRLRLSSSSD